MTTQWFNCSQPRPQARLRLICFPSAGNGASAYARWPLEFPASVEVWAVQPPGRETRLREAPIAHLSTIAHEVATQVRPLLDLPVAFFGHSMGAWVAFETARLLAADGLEPRMLFVSGKSAPHLRDKREGIDGLTDDDFLDAMDQLYGGIPALFRSDPEFRELYLPPLRADVSTLLRHVHVESAPLTCELHALGGLGDTSLTREELTAWRQHTTGTFGTHFFPGNHFFVQSARAEVIALVSGRLARLDRDTAACS